MHENPYATPQNDTTHGQDDNWARLSRDIRLSGSMSVRDVLMTQVLILKHRWFYAALTLGIYIAFVLALGLFTPGNRLFGNTFMVLGLIIMPAILPFTLLMIFLRLQRDSKQQVGIFADTETRLTGDGIQSSTSPDNVAIPWNTFSRFLCSEHVVLLFLKDSNDHLIIARSKLVNAEDWPVLLDYLRKRFPRSA